MGGKLNIYNLGVSGVVVDKSPVHELDGELLRAQNAQVDSVGALGGIRKRDGIAQLNPLVLAGAVTGMLPLPLPDDALLRKHWYLPLEGTVATWKTSTDGITWTDSAVPSRAATVIQSNMENAMTTIWAVAWRGFRNKLYFPGADYERGVTWPTLHMFDGTDDVIVGRVPPSPWDPALVPSKQITSIIPYSDHQLLVAVADNNISHGSSRVLLFDIGSHRFTTLGPDTNLMDGWILGGLCVWQGRIWCAGYHGDGGTAVNLHSTRPTDKTWTSEYIGPNCSYVVGLTVFKGNLYIGCAAYTGANGFMYRRTPTGVFTQVYTSDGTGGLNWVGPMIVTQDGQTMLAFQNSVSGGAAPQVRIIETTNGTTFTTAYNISSALGDSYGRAGMPNLDTTDGAIYWPIAAGSAGASDALLKRTKAGAWSIVLRDVHGIRGPLGAVRL